MTQQHMTNVEAVTELMEFSRYGALAQMFVIDALTKHAERVAAMTDEQVAKLDAESGMVNMTAWRGVAREIKAKLEQHLGGK